MCFSVRERAVACWDECRCACVASVAGVYIASVSYMFSVRVL